MHFITGGDEADQRREGDFVAKQDRYARTGEMMGLLRRLWTEDAAFDHWGRFYRLEGAFSSVKPCAPGGIPMFFAGAFPQAVAVGAEHADVYAFWGEPRRAVAERIATVRAQAHPSHQPRFSLSLRPIIAATEHEAWQRAESIAAKTVERIEAARRKIADRPDTYGGLGGPANATYSHRRDTTITISEGRKRLIEFSQQNDIHDERLWMKVANLTGAAGNSTALVGTPSQVADAMLAITTSASTTSSCGASTLSPTPEISAAASFPSSGPALKIATPAGCPGGGELDDR